MSALAILLTACGGGGGSAGGGPVQASPAGLYNGTGATRAFTVLVLDTGRYYALYGPTGGSTSVIAGVIVGDGTASGSTFASTNLHDFSLEAGVISLGTLTSTFAAKTSFNGSVAYSGGQTSVFTGTYNSAYETVPTLASVAGVYSGQVASVAGVETSTLTVNASGALSGTTSGGCSYTGTVEPHAAGNAYDVSTAFGAGCLFSGQTFKGHAYLSGKVLYAVVPKADLSTGALFVGTKP